MSRWKDILGELREVAPGVLRLNTFTCAHIAAKRWICGSSGTFCTTRNLSTVRSRFSKG
jgi:hypothetical protein